MSPPAEADSLSHLQEALRAQHIPITPKLHQKLNSKEISYYPWSLSQQWTNQTVVSQDLLSTSVISLAPNAQRHSVHKQHAQGHYMGAKGHCMGAQGHYMRAQGHYIGAQGPYIG